MCGRFLLQAESLEQAARLAHIPEWIQKELRFGEIFPSMPALVLEKNPDKDGLAADLAVFGCLYGEKKQRIINARAETAASKWMFRKALASNRAVVVCSAFYEWDAARQKVAFYRPYETLYLAALLIEDSFVILTRPANASVSFWHHRMPVVLLADQVQNWILDSNISQDILGQTGPVLDHSLMTPSVYQPSLFDEPSSTEKQTGS